MRQIIQFFGTLYRSGTSLQIRSKNEKDSDYVHIIDIPSLGMRASRTAD